MRQPIGAIGRLGHLQTGPPGQRGCGFCGGNAIAPAGEGFTQHIQPIKSTMAAHGFAAQPPGAHRGAVAAIATEQLIAAFARKHHLHFLPRGTGQKPGGDDGVVSGGIIHAGYDFRQMPPDHIAVDVYAHMPRTGGTRSSGSGFAFIGSTCHIKACGEGQHRRRVDARHRGQYGGGIGAAR